MSPEDDDMKAFRSLSVNTIEFVPKPASKAVAEAICGEPTNDWTGDICVGEKIGAEGPWSLKLRSIAAIRSMPPAGARLMSGGSLREKWMGEVSTFSTGMEARLDGVATGVGRTEVVMLMLTPLPYSASTCSRRPSICCLEGDGGPCWDNCDTARSIGGAIGAGNVAGEGICGDARVWCVCGVAG